MKKAKVITMPKRTKATAKEDKTWFYFFCYELYKMNWLKDNITPNIQMDTYKTYIESIIDDPENKDIYTFKDFVWDFGFNGMIYACYDEFMDSEYQNVEFMKALLGNARLIQIYTDAD